MIYVNTKDLKQGDIIEIVSLDPEDGFYNDRNLIIGKQFILLLNNKTNSFTQFKYINDEDAKKYLERYQQFLSTNDILFHFLSNDNEHSNPYQFSYKKVGQDIIKKSAENILTIGDVEKDREEIEQAALELYPDSEDLSQIYNAVDNEKRREGFMQGIKWERERIVVVEGKINTEDLYKTINEMIECEDAAKTYSSVYMQGESLNEDQLEGDITNAFIEGAKWQKQQSITILTKEALISREVLQPLYEEYKKHNNDSDENFYHFLLQYNTPNPQ